MAALLLVFYIGSRAARFILSARHPVGYDRLVSAIRHDDATEVRRILKSGVNPNRYPDSDLNRSLEDDITPLNIAAERGNLAVVTALLDFGADPNQGDGWHDNPLASAAEENHLDVMELLVKRGAMVNDEGLRSNALWSAAMSGKGPAVGFLLEHGANPNTSLSYEPYTTILKELTDQKCNPGCAHLIRKYGGHE